MSNDFETVDAVVAGGGAGGLNAAYQLTKLGVTPMVLEARGRAGGVVFGDDLGGVTVDLGAESFAKRSVYTLALCDELGLPTMDPSGHSWIWSHEDGGRAYRIPHGVLGIPSSLDDPDEYVLVEAFRDGDAGGAHVGSDHFRAAQAELPQYLAATPRIVSQDVDQDDWSELGEMRVD